jgi:hypothetical protein
VTSMAEAQQIDIEEVAPPAKKPKAKKADLVAMPATPAAPANPVATSDTTANEATALFGMIERLASNPDTPLERVEQVFALYQKVEASRARKAYDAAFAEMQPKLPVIERKGAIAHDEKGANKEKTGNKIIQSRYAKWEDIVEGVTPVLAEFGFALSFKIDQPTPDRVLVTGTLSHREGHRESTSFSLPIDGSGSKNNVQGWASSVSYGKRYTGCALLNIVSRGEDDDGVAAGAAALTDEQVNTLFDLVVETGANLEQFLIAARVTPFDDEDERTPETVRARIAEIKPSEYQRLHNLLNAKKAKAVRS